MRTFRVLIREWTPTNFEIVVLGHQLSVLRRSATSSAAWSTSTTRLPDGKCEFWDPTGFSSVAYSISAS